MKTNVNLNAHHSNTQRDSNENESLLPRNPVPKKQPILGRFSFEVCCKTLLQCALKNVRNAGPAFLLPPLALPCTSNPLTGQCQVAVMPFACACGRPLAHTRYRVKSYVCEYVTCIIVAWVVWKIVFCFVSMDLFLFFFYPTNLPTFLR